MIELGWGRNNPAFRQIYTSKFVPDASLEQIRWFNDLQRASVSPKNAILFEKVFGDIDVFDLLPEISVPSLVMHARDDEVVPFDNGRQLAALIPGARFVPLEGRNHIILEEEPAWPRFLHEIRHFVGVTESGLSTELQTISSSGAKTAANEAQEIYSLISTLSEVTISRYRVIGNYVRYNEAERNKLKDAKQKVLTGFETPLGRENYLIWGPPGSGKTYFVQQVATHLKGKVRYHELNLAELNDKRFQSSLEELGAEERSLCLVDEVDAWANEPWPYEILLPYLDARVSKGTRWTFVLAGSSGSSLAEMKQRISSRSKGVDLLSRIPSEHEFMIPPMGSGDRVLVALSQFRGASKEMGLQVEEIEKLGLYYIALSPRLANARQLRESVVRCIERLQDGENRIKYDNLFSAGDPENKAFWMQAQSNANELVNVFVSFKD